ncbi:hypothetical protein GCM10023340_33830 [Nocardioides marinquilinus]|uniref:Secreted protein n=1 Tax=Nocardioides marinquilinus TaxID=1210400 RepID=A0ABP9PVG9_9ACTN
MLAVLVVLASVAWLTCLLVVVRWCVVSWCRETQPARSGSVFRPADIDLIPDGPRTGDYSTTSSAVEVKRREGSRGRARVLNRAIARFAHPTGPRGVLNRAIARLVHPTATQVSRRATCCTMRTPKWCSALVRPCITTKNPSPSR